MKTKDSNSRIVFPDYLRAAACLMVILVYAIEPLYLGGEGVYTASASDALWVTLLLTVAATFVAYAVIARIISMMPNSKYIIG